MKSKLIEKIEKYKIPVAAGLAALTLLFASVQGQRLPENKSFHRIYRTYGVLYGEFGAATMILDDNGKAKSAGYHSITKTDSGFTASIGSTTYLLDENGRYRKILSSTIPTRTRGW